MTTLTRYYVKELLKVFTVTLVIITMFMLWVGITFNLPEELKGLRIAQVLPFLLPEAVRNALQAASLFAACSVFGRMSAQNELVALNSLGIAPGFVVLPALILGLVASFAGVWLYEVGIFWGQTGIERAVLQSVDSIAYEQLTKHHQFGLPQMFLRVDAVDGRRLINPTASFFPAEGGDPVTVVAEECRLEPNPAKHTLSVFMRNGTIDSNGLKLNFYDTIERVVPLADDAAAVESWPPKNQTQQQLHALIALKKRAITKLEKALSADVIPIPPPNADGTQPPRPSPAAMRQQLETEQFRLRWLESQVYRRWTNGFFCLAFVMVGVPVAIMLRSGDHLSAFFLCFLPIVLLNHPLHSFCIRMSESGRMPAWSPWIGNVLLMACGVWLMQRLNRPGSHEFLKRLKFLVHLTSGRLRTPKTVAAP
jgi:lipopolysaccharide export system permease protein